MRNLLGSLIVSPRDSRLRVCILLFGSLGCLLASAMTVTANEPLFQPVPASSSLSESASIIFAKEDDSWVPSSWLKANRNSKWTRFEDRQAASSGVVAKNSLSSHLWLHDQPPACFPCSATHCATDQSECQASGDIDCESCCRSISLKEDLRHCTFTLWEDAKGIVNWNNTLILGAAAGLAIAFREGDADREVREWVDKHPNRWGSTGHTLGEFGNFAFQAPVLVGVYGYSVWAQDEELHDLMGTMLSAYTITGVSTVLLKLAVNSDRPSDKWNNGHYGFPSYHTASSFTIAAVLDEYYGCWVGLPAYALAGAIGYSRIDEQDHDLSDVVFGGAMGFVIGKAVAGRHICGNSRLKFTSYVHPTDGTPGVACEARF